MPPRTAKKWETITKSVQSFVSLHKGDDRKDEASIFWSLEWGRSVVNIQRSFGIPKTDISIAEGITGDDLAYYQTIGGHDWRVTLRMLNAQLGRAEIGFLTDPAPGFVLIDYLYDDAFSTDELFRRIRDVAQARLFLMGSMNLGKAKFGMRGAIPSEESGIDSMIDDGEDLKADRFKPEYAGGVLGPHKFSSTKHLISSIVLSRMANLEKEYGPVLDTQLVKKTIIEEDNFPPTLIREMIDYLMNIGLIEEVEPGRIRRIV